MPVTTTHNWPSTLPAPLIQYSGEPFYQNLVSPEEAPVLFRSRRFTRPYPVLQVTWIFTREQFESFETFFEEDLEQGVSWFTLDLRFPRNSTVTNWVVRFEGEYQSETVDRELWRVSAPLILLHEL